MEKVTRTEKVVNFQKVDSMSNLLLWINHGQQKENSKGYNQTVRFI